MKIVHIFHHFNPFGGAEEHITALAEMQLAQGQEVHVCLVQASAAGNQYYERLKQAGVRVQQWPVWLSRLSGDWNTREAILRGAVALITPFSAALSMVLALLSRRSRSNLRASIEGRLRTILGGMINLRRERALFLWMLASNYHQTSEVVVHLHSYGAGMEYVLAWARNRQLATVYQEHSTPDRSERPSYQLPTGLDDATIVVAVSEKSAQALRVLCGVRRPILVIPPLAAIAGDGDRRETAPRATLQNGRLNILTIARLTEEKGLEDLIAAAESVVAIRPEARFLIYGEGPLRQPLEAFIAAKRLGESVLLEGSFTRQQIAGILNHADLFVLPSRTEGLPLALVEALAAGLPVIATDVGGIPELIQDGYNGVLCPAGQPQALAKAVLALIESPARRAALAGAARSAYQNGPYRAENIATQFQQAYEMAIHEARRT